MIKDDNVCVAKYVDPAEPAEKYPSEPCQATETRLKVLIIHCHKIRGNLEKLAGEENSADCLVVYS